MKRLSLNIDLATHRKIKLAAIQHDETINKFVLRAVKEHLQTCHLHREDVDVASICTDMGDNME